MAMQLQPHRYPCRADTFDPSAWFADWSDHGGIVLLIEDRLWVGRTGAVDRTASERLDELRGALTRPGAGSALAGLLRAKAWEVEQ